MVSFNLGQKVWRLFSVFRYLWVVLLGGLILGVAANILTDLLKESKVSIASWVILLPRESGIWVGVGLLTLALLTGLSWRSKRNRDVKESLENAFKIYKPARELEPEDLGFQVLKPGETADLRYRPYFEIYLPRRAISYECRGERTSNTCFNEGDLSLALREGKSFVLLGPPLEGKSRTLYQIVKWIGGYEVMRPHKSKPVPHDDVFSLVRGKRILLLLEDLNDYAGAQLDLTEFCEKLEKYALSWRVAATCRDGPELKAVLEAIATGLRRFYEQIDLKLCLLPTTSIEKERLAESVGRKWDRSSSAMFPSPGSITMADSLQAMRLRFQALNPQQKDTLRSLQLLAYWGILPLTHERIQAVLRSIFKRCPPDIIDLLEPLTDHAFLRRPALQDPVRPEPAYLLGAVVYAEGKHPSDDLAALIELLASIDDASGLFFLGVINATLREDFRLALTCFEKALLIKQEFPEAWLNTGVALAKLNRHELALESINQCLSRGFSFAVVWFNKGVVLNSLGRYQEAVEAFDQSLKLRSTHPDAHTQRGVALNYLDRYEQALDSFEKALDLESASQDAWVGKGLTLIRLGRHEEALESIERALRMQPDDPAALSGKGEALVGLNRHREALVSYDRVVRLKPEDPGAWFDKAVVLGRLDRHQEALEAFQQTLRLKTDKPEAWAGEGDALVRLDKPQEALGAYDNALSIKPDFPLVWYARGLILYGLVQYQEALKSFDQAVNLNPFYSPAWFNRGLTLTHMNRHRDALEAYSKALSLSPNYPQAYYAKGMTLGTLGRIEEALQSLCAAWRGRSELSKDAASMIETYLRKLGHSPEDCEEKSQS